MSNLITEHNLSTGEVITREMTKTELAEKIKLDAEIEADKNSKLVNRQTLLDKLGITEEEAKLLLS